MRPAQVWVLTAQTARLASTQPRSPAWSRYARTHAHISGVTPTRRAFRSEPHLGSSGGGSSGGRQCHSGSHVRLRRLLGLARRGRLCGASVARATVGRPRARDWHRDWHHRRGRRWCTWSGRRWCRTRGRGGRGRDPKRSRGDAGDQRDAGDGWRQIGRSSRGRHRCGRCRRVGWSGRRNNRGAGRCSSRGGRRRGRSSGGSSGGSGQRGRGPRRDERRDQLWGGGCAGQLGGALLLELLPQGGRGRREEDGRGPCPGRHRGARARGQERRRQAAQQEAGHLVGEDRLGLHAVDVGQAGGVVRSRQRCRHNGPTVHMEHERQVDLGGLQDPGVARGVSERKPKEGTRSGFGGGEERTAGSGLTWRTTSSASGPVEASTMQGTARSRRGRKRAGPPPMDTVCTQCAGCSDHRRTVRPSVATVTSSACAMRRPARAFF